MVQVSPKLTIIDLTVRGISPGAYYATVRVAGDISRGAASTGGIWEGGEDRKDEAPRGRLGTMEVGLTGVGSLFLDKPVEVWELIGRSIVVSRHEEKFTKNDPDTIVGVIARSAGVWENEKIVCGNLTLMSSLALARSRNRLSRYQAPNSLGVRVNWDAKSSLLRNGVSDHAANTDYYLRSAPVQGKLFGMRGKKMSAGEWPDMRRVWLVMAWYGSGCRR